MPGRLSGSLTTAHANSPRDAISRFEPLVGMAGMEGDMAVVMDIFKFNQTGISDGNVLGEMQPTGIRPTLTPRLEAAGFKLGAEVFMAKDQSPAQRC